MLEVDLPADYADEELSRDPRYRIVVRARDAAGNFEELEGYVGADGRWHFETDPLMPGIPHVYRVWTDLVQIDTRVEIRAGRQVEETYETPVKPLDVRYVRLIMGRISELPF